MIYTTIITVIVGVFVAFVGFQQFLLSRERFKLDMFDRRFAVFRATQIFLNNVINLHPTNAESSSPWIKQFQNDSSSSLFLFDKSLSDYLIKLYDDGEHAAELLRMCNGPDAVGPEYTEHRNKAIEIRRKMLDVQIELTDKFSPYMKFSKWKYGFIFEITKS